MSERPTQRSYGRGGIYLAYSDTAQTPAANQNAVEAAPASVEAPKPFVRTPKVRHTAEIVEPLFPPAQGGGQQQQQTWQPMTQIRHTGAKFDF